MFKFIFKKLFKIELIRWKRDITNPIKGIIDHPDHDGKCWLCLSGVFYSHGYIRTKWGGLTVCPGDWIILIKNGVYYSKFLNKYRKKRENG